MKESADQVRQIIDAIPALAWSANPAGSAEFFNQRWLDYTGFTLGQAQGWGWTDALHPDDMKPLVDCWRSILVAALSLHGALRRVSRKVEVLRIQTDERRAIHGYIHDQRWHDDLLQGLGQRTTSGVQPRLAFEL
jgi:PAS domain-containing protein